MLQSRSRKRREGRPLPAVRLQHWDRSPQAEKRQHTQCPRAKKRSAKPQTPLPSERQPLSPPLSSPPLSPSAKRKGIQERNPQTPERQDPSAEEAPPSARGELSKGKDEEPAKQNEPPMQQGPTVEPVSAETPAGAPAGLKKRKMTFTNKRLLNFGSKSAPAFQWRSRETRVLCAAQTRAGPLHAESLVEKRRSTAARRPFASVFEVSCVSQKSKTLRRGGPPQRDGQDEAPFTTFQCISFHRNRQRKLREPRRGVSEKLF